MLFTYSRRSSMHNLRSINVKQTILSSILSLKRGGDWKQSDPLKIKDTPNGTYGLKCVQNNRAPQKENPAQQTREATVSPLKKRQKEQAHKKTISHKCNICIIS